MGHFQLNDFRQQAASGLPGSAGRYPTLLQPPKLQRHSGKDFSDLLCKLSLTAGLSSLVICWYVAWILHYHDIKGTMCIPMFSLSGIDKMNLVEQQ